MAGKLGVSQATYSAWETGRNVPTRDSEIAVKLENVTGVAREWFLGWADESPHPEGPDGGNSAGATRPAGKTSLYHLPRTLAFPATGATRHDRKAA